MLRILDSRSRPSAIFSVVHERKPHFVDKLLYDIQNSSFTMEKDNGKGRGKGNGSIVSPSMYLVMLYAVTINCFKYIL